MRPHPKHFTALDDFAAAFVDHELSKMPQPEHYDDFAAAAAKRRALYIAADVAADHAADLWAAHVERMEDLYERGIGSAWA